MQREGCLISLHFILLCLTFIRSNKSVLKRVTFRTCPLLSKYILQFMLHVTDFVVLSCEGIMRLGAVLSMFISVISGHKKSYSGR